MGLRQFCLGVLIVLLCFAPGHSAIRLDAAADLIARSSGAPAFGDLTRMVWIYRSVDQAVDEIAFYIASSSAFNNYFGMYCAGSTAEIVVDTLGLGVSTGSTTSFVPVLGTWYHITQVFSDSANTLSTYVNGVLQTGGTITGMTGTTTWGYESFGNTTSGGSNPFNGRFYGFKEYTAILTATEILAEMKYITPLRRANLHSYSPFRTATELTSYVGGTNWTASGTLATETPDPVMINGVSPGNAFLSF